MNLQNNLHQKHGGQGKNALDIRQQNELAVINFLRYNDGASRTQLAKHLGVTSQALATISEKLVAKKLIKKVGKQQLKSRGQPPAIYRLDPTGAYSVGLNIGRTHTDIILINFCGGIVERRRFEYKHPDPDNILDYLTHNYNDIMAALKSAERRSSAGVGMSMPYYMNLWDRELSYSPKLMAKWSNFTMRQQLSRQLKQEVLMERDTAASALGEVFFGKHKDLDSFLYIHIGTFPGGGLIMNRKLIAGSNFNAGSIGSMLVPAGKLLSQGGGRKPPQTVQFLYRAGLYALRSYLAKRDYKFTSFTELFETLLKDTNINSYVDDWVEDAAEAIAYVCISATALMDFKAIMIDGALPEFWLRRIIERSEDYYGRLESRGIIRPDFYQGTHGVDARSLGSATLPLYRIFG